MDELLEFSNDKTNILQRYIVACQIITNLIDYGEGYLYNEENFDDNVDLSICKLLLDGDIIVEPEERKLH